MLQIITYVQKFAKECIEIVIAAGRHTQMHTKQASLKGTADRESACIIELRFGNSLAQ